MAQSKTYGAAQLTDMVRSTSLIEGAATDAYVDAVRAIQAVEGLSLADCLAALDQCVTKLQALRAMAHSRGVSAGTLPDDCPF